MKGGAHFTPSRVQKLYSHTTRLGGVSSRHRRRLNTCARQKFPRLVSIAMCDDPVDPFIASLDVCQFCANARKTAVSRGPGTRKNGLASMLGR